MNQSKVVSLVRFFQYFLKNINEEMDQVLGDAF